MAFDVFLCIRPLCVTRVQTGSYRAGPRDAPSPARTLKTQNENEKLVISSTYTEYI